MLRVIVGSRNHMRDPFEHIRIAIGSIRPARLDTSKPYHTPVVDDIGFFEPIVLVARAILVISVVAGQ